MLDNMKPNAGTKCPISLVVSSLQLTLVFIVIKLTIRRNSKKHKGYWHNVQKTLTSSKTSTMLASSYRNIVYINAKSI